VLCRIELHPTSHSPIIFTKNTRRRIGFRIPLSPTFFLDTFQVFGDKRQVLMRSPPFSLPLFIIMKCELRISRWCRKTINKKTACYINKKACCYNCCWLKKRLIKEKNE